MVTVGVDDSRLLADSRLKFAKDQQPLGTVPHSSDCIPYSQG